MQISKNCLISKSQTKRTSNLVSQNIRKGQCQISRTSPHPHTDTNTHKIGDDVNLTPFRKLSNPLAYCIAMYPPAPDNNLLYLLYKVQTA